MVLWKCDDRATRDDGDKPVAPTTSNEVCATTIIVSTSDNEVTSGTATGELVPSDTIKMQMRYEGCRRNVCFAMKIKLLLKVTRYLYILLHVRTGRSGALLDG